MHEHLYEIQYRMTSMYFFSLFEIARFNAKIHHEFEMKIGVNN